MKTRSSSSIINRDRHFVFMTTTAENQFSYKYIDTKGSKTVIALLLCLINFDSVFHNHPKLRKFICITHVFQGTVTRYVCSHVVSLETFLAANGFLTLQLLGIDVFKVQ